MLMDVVMSMPGLKVLPRAINNWEPLGHEMLTMKSCYTVMCYSWQQFDVSFSFRNSVT